MVVPKNKSYTLSMIFNLLELLVDKTSTIVAMYSFLFLLIISNICDIFLFAISLLITAIYYIKKSTDSY